MPKTSPAFQFYPKDWLADANVRGMTFEAKGVYVDLLAIYWNEGGLPADLGRLSRIVGVPLRRFEKLWQMIHSCFVVMNGRLFQKRIEEEMAKQQAYRDLQAEKGIKSGKSRSINKDSEPRLSPGSTEGEPAPQGSVEPETNSSFSSSIASPTSTNNGHPPAPPNGGKAHGARKPVRGDAAKLSRVDTLDNRAVLSLRYELCGGDDRVTLPGLEAVARARAAGFDLAAIRRVLEAIRDAGSLDKSLAAFCRYKNTKLGYWLRPETLQTILDELQASPPSADEEPEPRESEDARAARMEAEADAARGR